MGKGEMEDKERVLNLIKSLETPLDFFDDPIYTSEEKKAIKNYEHLALSFYSNLKHDGLISFDQVFLLSDKAKVEQNKNLRFFKIAMDISNKLVNTKEFGAEEQWFILLTIYCWYSEMIKNLLLEEAKEMHKSSNRKEWKGFMTLRQFLGVLNGYREGSHTVLFSEIDADLRNSFDHANINFNDEITYQDNDGILKNLKLDQMFSMFKKIAPLYGTLFTYKSKVFIEEVKTLAKKKGYL